MTDLLTLGADIEWPDHAAAELVRDRLEGDATWGRLAALAEWVAGVLPPTSPHGFERIRGLLLGAAPADGFAADAAHRVGVELRIVDEATGSPAQAVAAGAAIADAEVDAGADLLVLAMPHLGSDAAVTVAVLTNTEPVKVLSRGAAATDPDAWIQRAIEVRDARRRCMPLRDRPDELVEAIGSATLATAAGIVLRAAGRRTPVVLDGPAAAAAALLAYEAAPRAVRWWCAADLGPDPLQNLALTRLGMRAVMGLGTGRGDGLAAILAVPVLQAAVRLAG